MFDIIARYPNHDASKRIQQSEEHREDLDLLKSDDADYHHGFHAGALATARMFKEHAEGLDVASNDVSFLWTKRVQVLLCFPGAD